jgi:hypothetical protein
VQLLEYLTGRHRQLAVNFAETAMQAVIMPLIMLTSSIISVEEIAVENRCSETVPFVIVSLRK